MTFNDFLTSMGEVLFRSDITPFRIILCLGTALLFGIYIFLVYRVAVNNEFYSKDFNKSLVLMSVITSAIVLSIQSSLVVSLGMVGALSIVRYRTAIKSSLDLTFIFWSISVGIICGASLVMIAIMLCIFVTITLLITKNIQSPIALGLIVIHCDNLEDANKAIAEIKPTTSFLRLKNKSITRNSTEVVIEYKTNSDADLETALSNCKSINSFSIMNYDRETRL